MKTRKVKRETAGIALAACALLLAGCSKGDHDTMTHEGHGGAEAKAGEEKTGAAGNVAPYPLDICVVSGKKLGSMGEAYVISYEGREIKFCCDGCEEDFREDPAKWLTEIDTAAAKKR